MKRKSIFETKEQYLNFIKTWKQTTNEDTRKDLTLEHFILYRMFKGKDWKKCLSENSRQETIEYAEKRAKVTKPEYLSKWPFGDTINNDMIVKAREIMESL